MARRIPSPVAMPFPPLNLSQTGNMCPRIAVNATIKTSSEDKNAKANLTEINPLAISPIRTKIAGFRPSVLAVLVKPILPLPFF